MHNYRGKIWTWLTNTINNIINWGKDLVEKGKTAAQELVNNITNTIAELPGKVLDIGKNIVEGLWNGITGMGSWLGDKISGFASGVIEGFKSTFGIHSPSTLARDEVGRYIPQGVAVGIEADTDSALKAIDNMNNEIIQKMNKAVEIETGAINTNVGIKAIIREENRKPRTVNNDNGTVINNTQNFYEKNQTPYEQQKQAKQQLRRLAYGL